MRTILRFSFFGGVDCEAPIIDLGDWKVGGV